MQPKLITFDIFGTVVDWRRGMMEALRKNGVTMTEDDFDKVIDAQGSDEQKTFRSYREITARSLVKVFGIAPEVADLIGSRVGEWPLYPDSKAAIKRLLKIAPCIATTNSDLIHGQQVQNQLGYRFTDWFCAEELGVYKPNPEVWKTVSRRISLELNELWFHVSAYGDYDLEAAKELGLSGVFVNRPHSRTGPALYQVSDLNELADILEKQN